MGIFRTSTAHAPGKMNARSSRGTMRMRDVLAETVDLLSDTVDDDSPPLSPQEARAAEAIARGLFRGVQPLANMPGAGSAIITR